MNSAHAVDRFWQWARVARPELPEERPEAWAFGATTEHADDLLDLVLRGIKTGTASSLWDCEHDGEPVPELGDLSIILDGRDAPRALIRTTDVRVLPFNEVTADHAAAEGEGDRTLAGWRRGHRYFWEQYSTDPRGFAPDMPVVCERFELVWTSPNDDRPA